MVGADMMHLDYTFDGVGNLKSQTHTWATDANANNHTEDYTYDALNRLKKASSADGAQDFTYHANGNILSKTGTGVASGSHVGDYQYVASWDSSRPHAVKIAAGRAFEYNANGSMLKGKRNGSVFRTVEYTAFNKPSKIEASWPRLASARFEYGPSRNRYRRIDNLGLSGREQTTHYIGSTERIWRPDGTIQTKRYVMGEILVTETGISSNPTRELHFLVKDHLGSVRVIVDEAGVQVQQGFDAFGLRRFDDSKATLSLLQLVDYDSSLTTKGFTGHEMVDEVGLIHMNGRVYDPYIGRFLSADSIVQAPSASQSYNRYTYVFNNPLSHTDPSGHVVFGLVAAAVLAGGAGTWATTTVVFWTMFATSTADALLRGASLGDALVSGLIGGASAAAFVQLGSGFSTQSCFRNQLARDLGELGAFGLVGGITSQLQGGKFGHGFLSASLSGPITNGIAGPSPDAGRRTIARMLVGGGISELSGRKFANGAAYAAFTSAVEAAASAVETVTTTASGGSCRGLSCKRSGANWNQTGTGKTGEVAWTGSDVRSDPAVDALLVQSSVTQDGAREYGYTGHKFEICYGDGSCTAMLNRRPEQRGSADMISLKIVGRNSDTFAIHSHTSGSGSANEWFGPSDHAFLLRSKPLVPYMLSPSGVLNVMEAHSGNLWQRALTGPSAGTSVKWQGTMD